MFYMKKTLRFTLLCAMVLCGSSAMADTTTVGAEDNTTGWWTAFSDPYTIEPNKTLTLKFQNFTSKAENWNNWSVILTQDVDFGTEGSEYLVLRADNYGWQYGLNTGPDSDHGWFTSLASNYNWDTFKDDMDGATVQMTITRVYATVTVRADITTTGGTQYYEEMVLPCGDGTQNIRAYLTIDNAHIVIDNDATATTDSALPEPVEGTPVGSQDCTTGWWGAHSALNTLEANKTLHMEFTNYTAGTENYQNWVMVVTDGKYVTDNGYSADNEYLILRSDNYGWGSKYSAGMTTHYRVNAIPGFDELTDDDAKAALYWSTFRSEMQGAYVIMDITRWETSLDILVGMVAQNGAIWYETYKADSFADASQNLGVFLTVDHSYLVIDDSKTTITESADPTGVQTLKADNQPGSGVRYNLAGQQVASGYKGLVIENGRKVMMK